MSEKILCFNVRGRKLEKMNDVSITEYSEVKFNFYGNEWRDCLKIVNFCTNGDVHAVLLDSEDICEIPDDIFKTVSFSLFISGIRPGYTIKTNRLLINRFI